MSRFPKVSFGPIKHKVKFEALPDKKITKEFAEKNKENPRTHTQGDLRSAVQEEQEQEQEQEQEEEPAPGTQSGYSRVARNTWHQYKTVGVKGGAKFASIVAPP
ncbi:hypothetical protein K435DRAFT_844098 [Dendrothele bispora CBS 962.96]|uniref:Uncharacterized protein n=1 Tax=Dendrothele bispora (strain CBS 962.96) TaxID=1314807 RepID=A0A4S8L4L6_DENBC|nr:hypothetical protein K435DRAFT_844098 [Dendrothele bispora CBS 962.96]